MTHNAALVANPIATDPSIVGTRCDHSRLAHRMLASISHEGCPGWWGADVTDPTASTCYCPCHAESNGWPSWEQSLRRSTDLGFDSGL